MVSGFVSDRDGFYYDSAKFINPDKNKDGYWTGNDLILQIPFFLEEFDAKSVALCERRKVNCCIIFGNSTGHSCLQVDALRTGGETPLNASPGGLNKPNMRAVSYISFDGFKVSQSYYFGVGDRLYVNIKKGTSTGAEIVTTHVVQADGKSKKKRTSAKTRQEYLIGHIVEFESELVGMSKGMDQYISERNIDFYKSPCKQKAHIANE